VGYFSNLEAKDPPCDYDHSYTPPEQQLLWQLEELEARLYELTQRKTGEQDEGEHFSEDDLRYMLAGNVCTRHNPRGVRYVR
jgi:hypothetical protein